MKLLDSSRPWAIVGVFAFLAGVWYGMPMAATKQPSELQIAAFVAVLDRNTGEANAGRAE